MGYSDLAERIIINSEIPGNPALKGCVMTIKLPAVSDPWQLGQQVKRRLCQMHPRCRVSINLFQDRLFTRIEPLR